MRIAVISDLHLGYAPGTERHEDAFEAAEEAIRKSLDCDMIILPGDIFDSKNPGTEVLTRAMSILIRPLVSTNPTRLTGIGRDIRPPISDRGIPVLAIHGTHERKARGVVNPVQGLETAGFLVHLHCNGAVAENGGDKVCVQGLSGVPDQYAESVIKEWGPRPMEGCYNIFVFHQSLEGYLMAPDLLPLESLPEGFDLYICGHMHENKIGEIRGRPLLIPGSLVQTQLTKDSVKPRGFYKIDTSTGEMEFQELESQRAVFYLEGLDKAEAMQELGRISSLAGKKPLVRIKGPGEWLDEAKQLYGDRLIISAIGNKARPEGISLEDRSVSVREMGRDILREAMKSKGLEPRIFEDMFELLLEGKPEEAEEMLDKALDNSVAAKD